ncbi:MAG: SLC13 family permease [Algoriphagus sp.]|uniref:SLC13 family permease n=1 Tax=Algoriphagus sp. TaxID=1872435 RepID=UPI001802A1FF|nr:SLC13 family permease [Algoriphagus sp.]NVJ85984.1 SLC13 family permease [Algoriphagus sp.]
MTFEILITLILVAALILTLFKGWLRPSLAFLGTAIGLIGLQIIQVEDLLRGLANKQIILIFLLIILTAGIQRNVGPSFFFKLFHKTLSPFQFRFRMMVLVSGLSSVLNNTPVVALMIPFVKNWADKNHYAASKFLIPLSFATILGGMITLVGTSTNLVLNGLIAQEGLTLLGFADFLYLGLLVTVLGLLYLTFFSQSFLPDRKGSKEEIMGHLNEYLVETQVGASSNLIGKSIEEAGLRNLKELFLVEIKRGEEIIPAVDSSEKIFAGDQLFFAGNTGAILTLINEKNGLVLPEESHVEANGFSDLTEAIVPTGSSLIGQSLKNIGFRDRYKASVISIYRKGEKVRENLGETVLQAGDLLLLLCSKDFLNGASYRDLIVLSKAGELENKISWTRMLPSFSAILILLGGILGVLDLFLAAVLGIVVMLFSKVLNIPKIKEAVDLDLLVILASALALGTGIQQSGLAAFLVELIEEISPGLPVWGSIALLFLLTLGLTTLITNAAAVTIMFPIAYELGMQSGGNLTPFFVTIAFAASADFMTPIGYQTNLMVMGPGNYRFSDYFRIGLPLTLIYTLTVLVFIHYYYF